MRSALLVVVIVAAVALRVWLFRRRRGLRRPRAHLGLGPVESGVGLVAAREIRERLRSRIFRIGTILILAVVAAAIVIPTFHGGKPAPERVGVVGSFPAALRSTVVSSAKGVGTSVRFVDEASLGAARRALRAGRVDVAIVDGQRLLLDTPIGANDNSTNAQFVQLAATNLGNTVAFLAAHLTPAQASELIRARALPVNSLEKGTTTKTRVSGTSITGTILIFMMLSQYNTWILIGVMEEKSSRVIEVLLAALRPGQLLSGKVLGIGLVAFAQAAAIVAFALALGQGVGSDLLHGTAPLVLVSILVWLVVGYAFYCWVYAAVGSMAERQDQIQTLAFPLSLPMIFGYIMALTAASTGSASVLVKVLGYLPPTAPFVMPVLVGFGDVTWWEFLASVVFSAVCTVGVARVATRVYRRAILRTGRRVTWREVVSRAS
ncbi:MAG: ABC transporter permease [Acidimicrobiales bacterium]